MTADQSASRTPADPTAATGQPLRVSIVALPSAAEAAAMARRRVRDVLKSWCLAHLEDTATLLVSELVTNALLHTYNGGFGLELRLESDASWLRAEVVDGDPALPQPRTPSRMSEGGFGLMLVEMMADKWGVRETADGKAVWIELAATKADEPDDALNARLACGTACEKA